VFSLINLVVGSLKVLLLAKGKKIIKGNLLWRWNMNEYLLKRNKYG